MSPWVDLSSLDAQLGELYTRVSAANANGRKARAVIAGISPNVVALRGEQPDFPRTLGETTLLREISQDPVFPAVRRARTVKYKLQLLCLLLRNIRILFRGGKR